MKIYDDIELSKIRTAWEYFQKTTAFYDEASLKHYIANNIRQPLKAIGKPLSALDASGKSTDAQVEQQIAQAANRIRILYAQHTFSKFEKTNVAHNEKLIAYIQQSLRDRLAKAGKDLAALDPSGNSTKEQMEQRLQQAVERVRKIGAKKVFNDEAAKKPDQPPPPANSPVEPPAKKNDGPHLQ